MVDNSIAKVYRYLKRMVVYQPPQEPKPFVLGEPRYDSELAPEAVREFDESEQFRAYIAFGKKLAAVMAEAGQVLAGEAVSEQTLGKVKQDIDALEQEYAALSPVVLSYTVGLDAVDRPISPSLKENREILTDLYHSNSNKDLLLRNLSLPGEPPKEAILVFLDGIIDKQLIDLAILKPLMGLDPAVTKPLGLAVLHSLAETCLPSNEAVVVSTWQEVVDGVNTGDTALLVDGSPGAIILSTKGYEQRSVGMPQNEQTVRGAQVAFTEGLRTNTGLIRSFLPTENLVTEIMMVGSRVKQRCAVMYLKNLANEKLVTEVKRRIDGIETDYIVNTSVQEGFIIDHPGNPFPQSLSTERPDRVASALVHGQVALLFEGTPFAHVLPVNFFTFFQSAEDFSPQGGVATFMRLLRLIGAAISVLLPSLYLAISYFHQEALPTDLVLAIAGAREEVPFPAALELLILEVSFELIREASMRIPGMMGSTIGIVGAIILGQAAVAARLVSPIVVVVIAITGLASFTIPDYRMSSVLRILRFGFFAAAIALGLVGISFAMLLLLTVLCSMKSFGVPYLVPVAPKTMTGLDVIVRGPVFRQESPIDSLNPQDQNRQPPIARQWTKQPATGSRGDEP